MSGWLSGYVARRPAQQRYVEHRQGAREFLRFAAGHHFRVITHRYPLDAADRALADLEHGRFEGAAVLVDG